MNTRQQDSTSTPTSGGTVKNDVGQQVIQGTPHQPLPGERKRGEKSGIDMNPGEPAHPYEPFNEGQQQGETDRTRAPQSTDRDRRQPV